MLWTGSTLRYNHVLATGEEGLGQTGLDGMKKLRRYSHASAMEKIHILQNVDLVDKDTDQNFEKVSNTYDICTSIGRPVAETKIFLSHSNEAFNQSVQAEFLLGTSNTKSYFCWTLFALEQAMERESIFLIN